jgi:hypothetical protein
MQTVLATMSCRRGLGGFILPVHIVQFKNPLPGETRMKGMIRVLIVVGLIAPLTQAVAESKAEQEARCNTYANDAVAQYNQAVAHAQCKINVDLVWQPSREYHYAACMNVSRDAAEFTAKTRDDTLKLCATGPAQSATIPLPTEIKQCERSLLKFCGIWTLNGDQYVASWSDGSKALLSVTRFDGHSIALHRIDTPDSKNAGMTADYLGDIDSGKIKGKVTYTWPGHLPPVGYGTWDATFTSAPLPTGDTTPPTSTALPTTSASVAQVAAASTQSTQSTTGKVAATTPPPVTNSSGECGLPTMPLSWADSSFKRYVGQMWKVNNGVLSYTDITDRKPVAVTFAISRPQFWRRFAACAPPQFKPQIASDSGFWIWVSADKHEARVFELMAGPHNMQMYAIAVPVNLVLEEEAQSR